MTSVGIGIGVSIISALSYFFYKRSQKDVIPTKWKKVGTLDKLYFVPIKSCAPIELDEASCENIGVQKGDIKDRSLMLIDKTGQVITNRTYPQMFKIIPKIVSRSELVISAPGMEDIRFDFATLGEDPKGDTTALVGGFFVMVLNCGEIYNTWFSRYILGETVGLRFVYYHHKVTTRPVSRYYKDDLYNKRHTGTSQDMSNYHLINNVSVDELNARLRDDEKIPLLQFRANFYVKNTGPAFDEDYWQWVRIGNDVVFRNVGPCNRCTVQNINPYTSARHPDGEPLKSLKKCRVAPGSTFDSPGMGIQLSLRAEGSVKRGDCIYIEFNN